jgi:hypothetical protein
MLCDENDIKIIQWIKDNDLKEMLLSVMKRPDAYTRFLTGVGGWHFEEEFSNKCTDLKILCKIAQKGLPYDFITGENKWRVQCKLTCLEHIDLRSKIKKSRNYSLDALDILAIKMINKNGNNYYIVPLQQAKSILASDKHPGYIRNSINPFKLNDYKNAWHFLN